jgi:DNA invertase Pin-like site-specific DNA recombinase
VSLEASGTPTAIAYVRASSREQEIEGLTLPEQKGRLAAEAARRGYELTTIVTDTKSGKRMEGRQLGLVLDRLDAGEFDVLLVTRLDRIARSLIDFLPVLERSSKHEWMLVMLDPAVDTTTPYGKAMAQMGGVFAELEGALISQRTKEGLAYARARGTFRPGEHCRYSDTVVIERIKRWKAQGLSAPKIAERLTTEGVQPPNGAVWHPRTINRIIQREATR